MKAYDVKYYDMSDFSYHAIVVADSEEEARAKVLKKYKNIDVVKVEQLHDTVVWNIRGVETTTGITLQQQWTSSLPEAQAKKDAKWIGTCFKSDNPQLFKKGQRANFRVDLFLADSRVTVADRIADYDNRASITVIR